MTMTASRPYLIRAIYDWILDNDATPYLLVNALAEGASVPQEFVQNGQIVLNIAPRAIDTLEMGNEWIMFSGRFGGIARQLEVPVHAVLGIYARENGQGMMFDQDDLQPPDPTPPSGSKEPKLKSVPGGKTGGDSKKKPSLTVVK